jgi:hypothetical protein
MGLKRLGHLILGVFSLASFSLADSDENLTQAKSYLKDYLKQTNEKYPFSVWEKQLANCRSSLDRIHAKVGGATPKFDPNLFLALEKLSKDVEQSTRHRAEVNILVRQLYASYLVSKIDERFSQAGKPWEAESRLTFQRMLMQYEAGSLKPKSIFLANAAALDRDFNTLQTGLLFAYAQDYLGRRVEEHLRKFELAKIENLYSGYSLQLDYWIKQFTGSAAQTKAQLLVLDQQYEANKGWVRQNLEGLVEVLNTDMLFSDLLAYASQNKVEFTLAVEEKIEAALKERNQANLAPIQERIISWKLLAGTIRERVSMAEEQLRTQEHQDMAKADADRKEREQLEALQREQRRLEQEQTAKFKETLVALRTFTFKTETSMELDDDSKKALSTKAGLLKTSYVGSGSNKLSVAKEKFSDSLAWVQKFKVENKQVDFSKMSLQERSNQSAYTYVSPAGRTNHGDLANFVSEVALGSFSTSYSFLSYQAPSRWTIGHPVGWIPERSGEKVVQDREFSYVDLVVDAHRKRSGKGSIRRESSANLPANMLVVLDPRGAIIRFQPFADISKVSIKSTDLVGGKVYFKFLNYSADRQHIYLNGIDCELKVALPASKS